MENKDIRIINETTTIELSKKFAKAAQYFGTDEFNTLQNVRAMFPGYSVKVKTIKKAQSKDSYRHRRDRSAPSLHQQEKGRAITSRQGAEGPPREILQVSKMP